MSGGGPTGPTPPAAAEQARAAGAAAAVAETRPPRPARFRRRSGTSRPNVLATIPALAWLVVVGVPLYYVVQGSLGSRQEYLTGTFLAWPDEPIPDNFRRALDSGFTGYLVNTGIVTVATVAIVLALAIPAAYAIARSRSLVVSRGFSLLLAGLAIPAQAIIVPLYFIITRMHLYDSLTAIILPTAAFSLPVAVLVLTNALRDVPRELYEAMTLDGATPGLLLRRLVLPLSRPALMTVGVYTAIGAWNGFLFPLVLTQSPEVRVLTLGLWNFQGQFGTDYPALLAAVLLSGLPIFVVYLFGRRHLIGGLTAGAGK